MSTAVGPSSQEVRAALREAADWVASYLETVGERRVLARVNPGDIAATLPASAPAEGEPLDAILADLDRLILPGITHWNHPSFFAYFGITGSGPGIVVHWRVATPGVPARPDDACVHHRGEDPQPARRRLVGRGA